MPGWCTATFLAGPLVVDQAGLVWAYSGSVLGHDTAMLLSHLPNHPDRAPDTTCSVSVQ